MAFQVNCIHLFIVELCTIQTIDSSILPFSASSELKIWRKAPGIHNWTFFVSCNRVLHNQLKWNHIASLNFIQLKMRALQFCSKYLQFILLVTLPLCIPSFFTLYSHQILWSSFHIFVVVPRFLFTVLIMRIFTGFFFSLHFVLPCLFI